MLIRCFLSKIFNFGARWACGGQLKVFIQVFDYLINQVSYTWKEFRVHFDKFEGSNGITWRIGREEKSTSQANNVEVCRKIELES